MTTVSSNTHLSVITTTAAPITTYYNVLESSSVLSSKEVKNIDFYLQLKNRDFTDVDGLEPSSEMLKIATEKGVYQQYYCDTLDGRNVKIPDGK